MAQIQEGVIVNSRIAAARTQEACSVSLLSVYPISERAISNITVPVFTALEARNTAVAGI